MGIILCGRGSRSVALCAHLFGELFWEIRAGIEFSIQLHGKKIAAAACTTTAALAAATDVYFFFYSSKVKTIEVDKEDSKRAQLAKEKKVGVDRK